MKKNSLWKKISLSVISILLILIILETICFFNEKNYSFDKHVYVQAAMPSLHRLSNIPGLSYELIPYSETEDGFYKINSHGIRDAEYDIPKPEGVYRIIVLGDSVTFGTEYPVNLTYAKLLEKKLNQKSSDGIKYEVLNAGVCAYNAIQKLIFLKQKLIEYQPDLVIFQFLKDDYYRNAVILPGNINKEHHMFINIGEYFALNFPRIIPLPKSMDKFLKKHSTVYRLINKNIYDLLSLKNPDKYISQGYRYAGFNNLNESMQENKKAFEGFKRISRDKGFKFVLMLVPDLKNTDDMDMWIRQAGSQKFDFKTLDLFDEFRFLGIDLTTLRIVPKGICHFNEKGHEFVAEIIYCWLWDNVDLKLK